MNKRKIIVTGFGPFNEHTINASWEAVRLLPELLAETDFELIIEEIPVTYKDVDERIKILWEIHSPWLVIHVGVSSVTEKITIETIANRSGYVKPDCLRNYNLTSSCSSEGEDIIKCGIDVKTICKNLENATVQICASDDAGRYLCEYIFYKSLNKDRSRVMFVHVPRLNEPYSASELAGGLKLIIDEAIIQLKQCPEINSLD